MNKTLLQRLDEEVPPFLAFAMARVKARGTWAGPVVVSRRSGLPHRTVTRLGGKISWKGVKVGVASAFLQACGFRVKKHGIIVLNKTRAYLRWCATQAICPFDHMDDQQWRLFNERSKEWNKLHSEEVESNGGTSSEILAVSKRSLPGRSLLCRRLTGANAALLVTNKKYLLMMRVSVLMRKGMGYDQIAKTLGISKGEARKAGSDLNRMAYAALNNLGEQKEIKLQLVKR